MHPVIQVDALVPTLRCPDRRCRQAFIHAETEEPFRGVLKCVRSSCRQRWFAEPLQRGSVRHQLEESYGDPSIVRDLMERLRLPEFIEAPAFVQIPLNSELWSGYISDRESRPRSRTRRLIRGALDALVQRVASCS